MNREKTDWYSYSLLGQQGHQLDTKWRGKLHTCAPKFLSLLLCFLSRQHRRDNATWGTSRNDIEFSLRYVHIRRLFRPPACCSKLHDRRFKQQAPVCQSCNRRKRCTSAHPACRFTMTKTTTLDNCNIIDFLRYGFSFLTSNDRQQRRKQLWTMADDDET